MCTRFPPVSFWHTQASSRIIGRQGAFIKQLQRESGCKINTLKDTDLRSGLKARVMNVCGTNSSMSKGLYLIARKIASRWEYATEWEGGDPTLPAGQGLPTSTVPPHAAPPPETDGDSGREGSRRQRGGRSGGGRGGRDRGGDLDRYERDGSRARGGGGESDRRGGGDRSDARDGGGRYGRGGGRDDGPSGGGGGGGRDASKTSRSGTASLQTTSAPWVSDQPSGLPSVVGGPPAPAPGSAAAAAASAEAWQRLLGQIPATARESLGFGAVPVPAPAPADVFQQFAGRAAVAAAAPQQLQQPPQVWVCVVLVSGGAGFLRVCHFGCLCRESWRPCVSLRSLYTCKFMFLAPRPLLGGGLGPVVAHRGLTRSFFCAITDSCRGQEYRFFFKDLFVIVPQISGETGWACCCCARLCAGCKEKVLAR